MTGCSIGGGEDFAAVTPATCRAYLAAGKRGGVRRNLEDLRAAINHHASRGLHMQAGSVMIELPQKGAPRYALADALGSGSATLGVLALP